MASSKEEILDNVLSKKFGEIEREECLEAMEDYAKQVGIDILKKISYHSKIFPIDDECFYDGLDVSHKIRYEELYNLLLAIKK